MKIRALFWRLAAVAGLSGAVACGSSQAAAPPPAPPPADDRPPPPAGPTRTDFKTIAGKLVSRCAAGGWVSEWRSKQPDVEIARPKVFLREFEDKTGQNLDPQYLSAELQRRLKLAKIYDLVGENDQPHFIARGRLMRLAERGKGGRISVYTAVLEMVEPGTDRVAYSCEATVEGEL